MYVSLNRCAKGVFTKHFLCGLGLLLISLGFGWRQAVAAQSQAGQAADTAALTGTVFDPSGNVIQNATVLVRNAVGEVVSRTTTGADGTFSVSGLSAGVYTAEISASGFETYKRAGVQLAAGKTEDISIALTVASLSQEVTVTGAVAESIAAQLAPMQAPLDTPTAVTEITGEYIKEFTSPIADFGEVIAMAPGTIDLSPNGYGLGQGKFYFRGFADPKYNVTFDGIPFYDTNDGSHHTWSYFPSQWLGGTEFDRSPGTASTIGPNAFGGTIGLKSLDPLPYMDILGTISYGSWNTRLYDLTFDSGQFGGVAKANSFLLDMHGMQSDGYQTYNYQQRIAGSIKYVHKFSDKLVLTGFAGLVNLTNNTPNTGGPTRAQVAEYGYNYLNSNNPALPNYYGYNFYHIPTDFEDVELKAELGSGWLLDNKAYTNQYYNHQNYATTLTQTGGTDKYNTYRHYGDIMTVSRESRWGILRTGYWYDWSTTNRYQIPTNPVDWFDAILPNFHERYITQSLMPYASYDFKVTPRLTIAAGFRFAYFTLDLNQYDDNGKTVGCLGGGVLSGPTSNPLTTCVGGVEFVSHGTTYHSSLPQADIRYRLKDNWSVYAQFATGSVVPPTSVYDVKGALVLTPPEPTTTKTEQAGTTWKTKRVTVDFDAYYSHFQNTYSSYSNAATDFEPVYILTAPSNTKGVEVESNIFITRGISLYINATKGAARYQDTQLWVADTPKDTETQGLLYQWRDWDAGLINKRVGWMWNANGSLQQAVAIRPWDLTNLYFNYTIKGTSRWNGTKLRLSFNNLLDQHNIVGVTPASTASNLPNPNDILNILPGRSVMMSVTFGWAPGR